jgi:hypothetical protein
MKDPAAAFGFGKELACCSLLIKDNRACPGRRMGENRIFLAVASILHVFDIVPPPGSSPPDSNAFIPGFFSLVLLFGVI